MSKPYEGTLFVHLLRRAIEASGLSNKEIAYQVGIRPNMLSNITTGATPLPFNRFAKLLIVLKIPSTFEPLFTFAAIAYRSNKTWRDLARMCEVVGGWSNIYPHFVEYPEFTIDTKTAMALEEEFQSTRRSHSAS